MSPENLGIEELGKEHDKPVSQIVGDDLTLVVFVASWCGPCTLAKPIIRDLARDVELADLRLVLIDVDEMWEATQSQRVKWVPTYEIWNDGEMVEAAIGVRTAQQLKRMVAKARS